MDRKLFALTLSAFASASVFAQQQSTVEIYGVMDGGVSHTSGLRGGSSKQLVSGIMDGSRLGFKGTEDLGGGWKALFLLENRIELDQGNVSNRAPSGSQTPDRLNQASLVLTGQSAGVQAALQPAVTGVSNLIGSQIGVNSTTNNFWDRQAYLGLVTPWGAVLAGRQYTPAYEVSAIFDTLGTQSGLALGQVASFPPTVDIRLSNTVAYRAQKGPWSGSLMVAPGEGSTTSGSFFGGNFVYKGDAFSMGVGYNQRENELGEKSLTSLLVGASLKVGTGTVYGALGSVKDDHPSGLSTIPTVLTPSVGAGPAALVHSAFIQAMKQDAKIGHIGYKFIKGPHTVYVATSAYADDRPANADVLSYGAAYTYSFSKRTDVNLVAVRFDNKGLGQAAPGQAGSLGGVTASAGKDSTGLSLGLRHRF